MKMSDAPFADATEANTEDLWSPPSDYFKPHSSAIQYPRTGGLIDLDTQEPVSPKRFNAKGELTATRGLPTTSHQ